MTAAEMSPAEAHINVSNLPIDLKSSSFLQHLLGLVAETLEDVVGLEDASGFIALVGQQMGNQINELYTQALGDRPLDAKTVAQILIDLKNRIEGRFFLIAQDEERIILGNQRCPLGSGVVGHPSLCMMTSNVFGVIVADHLGYAKVCIEEAIANGEKTYLEITNNQPVMYLTEDFKIEYYHNVAETQTNPQTGQQETVIVRRESNFWSPFAGALAGQVVGNMLFAPRYYVPPVYTSGRPLTGYGGVGTSFDGAVQNYQTNHNSPPPVVKNRQVLRTSGTARRSTPTTTTKRNSGTKSSGSGFGSSDLNTPRRSSNPTRTTRPKSGSFGSSGRVRTRRR